MKTNLTIAALLVVALAAPAALAQKQEKQGGQKTKPAERLEPDDQTRVRQDVPESVLANRREQTSEEADAEIPSYNNFMSTYLLGPEDVISISVFNHERYSRANITVPPDGRIDYFFIRDGLHVAGKTRQQVADEITRHLDEYIIDPKVTVSLEKAQSHYYGVLGDVAQPGIRQMSRRLSVMEAVYTAGGVLPTGKKQVVVLHWNADRMLQTTTVDLAAIEKGKAPDNYFLRPGDQVVVPGNRWKTVDKVLKALPVISFARIFTGGF
ncbi:MAG TPA: polysaccharide biosynthesis/export family protein [Pyrinomonadaceae bacterium]|jgi:protein involved in polysaccharide export with SLBB domain|nr:polysaccharide biosynthesis/export family protein [Pyrinomonadaceae bacterium]